MVRGAEGGRGIESGARTDDSPHTSRKKIAERIWSLLAVGSASHWSAGPPAAAISLNIVTGPLSAGKTTSVGPRKPVSAQGKTMLLLWTQKPTKAAIAMRPCLISAWRRKPIAASSDSPHHSILRPVVGSTLVSPSPRGFQ